MHGYLPDTVMSDFLVPIIKDKSVKINSKDNYMPITIASTMSKLLKILLLERLSNLLLITSHQFGLKKIITQIHVYMSLKRLLIFILHNKVVFIFAFSRPQKRLTGLSTLYYMIEL